MGDGVLPDGQPPKQESKSEFIFGNLENEMAQIEKDKATIAQGASKVSSFFSETWKYDIGIILFLLALSLSVYFLSKAVDGKDAQIKALTTQIQQREDSVKVRDKLILELNKRSQADNIELQKSRDTVNLYYAKLTKINTINKIQYATYKKDSVAIRAMSMRDRLNFITGTKH